MIHAQEAYVDSNVERVREMLALRAARGYTKYGVTTDREDLNTYDWLNHLQEELLDAAIYIEKLKGIFNGKAV